MTSSGRVAPTMTPKPPPPLAGFTTNGVVSGSMRRGSKFGSVSYGGRMIVSGKLQAAREQFAVDVGLVDGALVVMVRVDELRALGLQQLIELEKARVFVAGAVEEIVEAALVVLDFEVRFAGDCASRRGNNSGRR